MRPFVSPFLRLLTLALLPLTTQAAVILRIDCNDAIDSAADTAPGHVAYTLTEDTLRVAPYSFDVNPAGGATLDDVHRTLPADSGSLTLAALYRDAIFAAPDSTANYYRVGLDAVVAGLIPGKRYTLNAWSFDSGSSGVRTADWSAAGLGGPTFAVNNYTFNSTASPTSDATNRFTITTRADANGTITLRGRQAGTATSPQVFLNGISVDELPDAALEPRVLLALDVNDRASSSSPPGFQEYLLSGAEGAAQTTTSRVINGHTVTLTAVGTTLDDRLRSTPSDSGPFNEADLMRDFVFATSTGGLDARVQGLTAGQSYLVELWSFDGLSTLLRVSDWTVNGAMLWDDYAFAGSNTPATNHDYKMSGVFTANTAGELLISGRIGTGTTAGQPAVFLDALRISALVPVTVVDLGTPILAEFMADNGGGIVDEDGEASDWIEIWNSTPDPLNLGGWHLTDLATNKTKWTFPAGTTVPAQGRLLVWASGKNRAVDPTRLHTNFALAKASGGYLAFVRPDGVTVASEFSGLPAQRENISYGLAGTALPLTQGFFQTPTPRAANGSAVPGFVKDTVHTPNRGFFSAPFQATITCATPGAVIRYTTDGSEPTESSTAYPGGAGITINKTTVLRAKAFAPPLAPTNVDTQSYIFPAQVATQPANPPGWPATWGTDSEVATNNGGNGTVPADYEMDPNVVNATLPGYGVNEALAALPALSLTLDPAGFHSTGSGIYANPKSVGDAWERACAIELLRPDGSGFHERAGVRVHGNSSRRPFRMQKHSFRLAFRDLYGAGRLNHRLFSETTVDRFDKLILRACFTDSWGLVSWDAPRYRPDDSLTYRDVWMKQSHRAMGYNAPASDFFHLYVNGLYWGIYNASERIDDIYCADHFGGLPTDWDVLADFNELKAGTRTAWSAMFAQASAGLASPSSYAAIQQQLDVASFADYYLLHVHADCEDWPSHNWYAVRNRNVPGDKWRWLTWDQEIMLDNHAINRLSAADANTPGALLQALRQNAEFRLLFADRAHRHLHNNGALSLAISQARWQALANRLDRAIVAESARWGDTADATPYGNAASKPVYTREADWLPTVAMVKDTYLPSLFNRSNTFATIPKLRAAGLFPNTEPPAFAQHGGNVPANYTLAMSAAAGTIYYTLNGTDPREPVTGNVLGTPYTGAVTLTQTGVVKARVKNGAEWSALTEAQFIVGVAASAAQLVITELNYHPLISEEHEFIELANRSDVTIDLTDVQFTRGIAFTFPSGLLLAPGARILLVKNTVEFAAQHGPGLPVAGQFTGSLDNSGEELVLNAADGSEILRFNYDDASPWPTAPDGAGRTLVLRSFQAPPMSAANWRSSVAVNGTPGSRDDLAFVGNAAADLDGDGTIALLEHAFGTSDLDPATGTNLVQNLELLDIGGGPQTFLTITTSRNLAADDVQLTAELVGNLAGRWESAVFLGERLAADGKATLKWRALLPASTAPQQFIRLRATMVP